MTETRETYKRIRFLAELRSSWWVPLVCIIVGGLGAYLVARSQPNAYTARSQILVRSAPSVVTGPNNTTGATQVTPLGTSSTTIPNTVQLVTAQPMQSLVRLALAGKLAHRSSLADISQVTVTGGSTTSVTSAADQTSAILTITATSRSPHDAAAIANAFASKFVGYRLGLDQAVINSVADSTNRELQRQLKLNKRDSAVINELRAQSVDLAVAAGLQTGNVYVLSSANVPSAPSSPKPLRSAALGAALGLIIGMAILLLRAYLDRRVKTVEDVEEMLGVPCIGTVPDADLLREGGLVPGSPLLEPFRMASASLRYLVPRQPVGSVAVASAVSGEGKTTVARWLATSHASFEPTVLIDADLRKRTLSHLMLTRRSGTDNGLGNGARPERAHRMAGLADVILHTATAPEALRHVSLSPAESDEGPGAGGDPARAGQPATVPPDAVTEVVGEVPGLSFLDSGTPVPNPASLFARDGFDNAIATLANAGGTIYVDTPALRLAADALEIVQRVDSVLLVTRLGTTTIDDLHHLRKLITEHKLPVVGVIVNNVTIDRSYRAYGYEYGYRYGGTDVERDGDDGRNPAEPTADSSAPNGQSTKRARLRLRRRSRSLT